MCTGRSPTTAPTRRNWEIEATRDAILEDIRSEMATHRPADVEPECSMETESEWSFLIDHCLKPTNAERL